MVKQEIKAWDYYAGLAAGWAAAEYFRKSAHRSIADDPELIEDTVKFAEKFADRMILGRKQRFGTDEPSIMEKEFE
jgi:hypothetical protein